MNDGLVSSGPSDVTIHVRNTNDPPIARAGADISLNEAQPVALNGSESNDPNNDVMSYRWTQIGGLPIVALNGADSAIATFQRPGFRLRRCDSDFYLTVVTAN